MLTRVLERISTRTPGAMSVLIVVFLLTRLLGATGAINFGADSDVETAYHRWAVRVVEQDRPPYSDVDIEYPPASLPFVLAPQLPGPTKHNYRVIFVALMLLVDLIGFAGILLLAKRWGSMLGPWLWVVGIPLLGSFVYLRLDLVPAAATIWALQRAASKDWLGTGGSLGFGIAAKLYPLLLFPLALVFAPGRSRMRLVIGAAAIGVLAFLPFVTILGDVFREVVSYHTSRGIQIESLWGSILFIARSGDRNRFIFHDFGAHHFEFGAVPTLKIAASLATAAVAAAGVWLARKSAAVSQDVRELAGVSFVTLMLAISVTGVLSPQFFIWVLALGAATACTPGSRLQNQILMLLPILFITHLIYPTLHPSLVRAEAIPVIVLWCRNMLLLLTAIYAFTRQADIGRTAAAPTPEPVTA